MGSALTSAPSGNKTLIAPPVSVLLLMPSAARSLLFPPAAGIVPAAALRASTAPARSASVSPPDVAPRTAHAAARPSSNLSASPHTTNSPPARLGSVATRALRPAAGSSASARPSLSPAVPNLPASIALSLSLGTPAADSPNRATSPPPDRPHSPGTPAPPPHSPIGPPGKRAPRVLVNNFAASSAPRDRPSSPPLPAACSAPGTRAVLPSAQLFPPPRCGLPPRPLSCPAPSPLVRSRAPVRSGSIAPRAVAKQSPPAQ